MPTDLGKISVRYYIDTFMARQGKLLGVARRSQEATNDNNHWKRYANYQRLPQLRTRSVRDGVTEEHQYSKDDPSSMAHIVENATGGVNGEKRGSKGIRDPCNLDTYVK